MQLVLAFLLLGSILNLASKIAYIAHFSRRTHAAHRAGDVRQALHMRRQWKRALLGACANAVVAVLLAAILWTLSSVP